MKLVPSISFNEIKGDNRRQLCFNTSLYLCTCLNLFVSHQPVLCRCCDEGCVLCWGLDGDYSCYFRYYWKGIERINDSQNGCYGCSLYSLVCCFHVQASCVRCILCNNYNEDYIRENTVVSVSFNPVKKSKKSILMDTGIRIPYTRIK